MYRQILSGVCGLIICFSMIASNAIAAQTDDVEVIITLTDKSKNNWRKIIKNPEIKKILQKSKLYLLYPLTNKEEGTMHSNAANSILYMNRLLGKNEQYALVDEAYMTKSQEKRAKKMQETQKRVMNYMRNLSESKKNEAVSKSFDYSKRMWQLLMSGFSKLNSNEMDALINSETYGQLVFVNGELVPDYFEKLKKK